MKVLLIKTSSMGDVIHTLPALTDAGKALGDISFDWVIEEDFAEIPAWHPLVDKVIPMAFRRWRKAWFNKNNRLEFKQFKASINNQRYDFIIDGQGLLKSAWMTLYNPAKSGGLGWSSAREPLASLFYQQRCTVNFYQHAIIRMRSLFSQLLHYSQPMTLADYGIDRAGLASQAVEKKYIVFLHATSWLTKQWPEHYWQILANYVAEAGFTIKVSGGSAQELARAQRIGQACQAVEVLPRLTIGQMAALLANAKAVVAVDTGFAHLAAALSVPTVSLYSSSNPLYTGTVGVNQSHMAVDFPCAPCFKRACIINDDRHNPLAFCFNKITPGMVWSQLKPYL
jgi:heptosyltransferase I